MEKKLGIEIEFTGVTRREVVTALENLFNTVAEGIRSRTTEDRYMYHKIKDTNNDTWLIVRDRSITPEVYAHRLGEQSDNKRFDRIPLDRDSNLEYLVEVVTPPLTSKSLPILFTVVDVIKSLGVLLIQLVVYTYI